VRILAVFGTRPEAVKLAPVLAACQKAAGLSTVVCVTGQHREMLSPFLKLFGLRQAYDLKAMRDDQSLSGLTGRVLEGVERAISLERPDCVLVQGDTTSALAAALAAHYRQVPVAHVEAGLRTENRYDPFPEEMNRRLVTRLSGLHFAPTDWAERNLRREGVPAADIFVTGNPVVDALMTILKKTKPKALPADIRLPRGRKLVLVTAHRRENFGQGLESICRAILDIVEKAPEVEVVFPVHLNPNVRKTVIPRLGGRPRLHLTEPLDYVTFVHLMKRATLILTDSGGIQEEAPSLGKPVVVMRKTTERPEAVRAGVARLAGTDPERILRLTLSLLKKAGDPGLERAIIRRNPFGDGRSGRRIALILKRRFGA
jgi:UDP-N-acetylglucosamine 2-epimerase (non-hydrolysing)